MNEEKLSPTERAHHDYSPSTLQFLEACPAMRGTQSKAVHERTTAGTLAHGVAETGVDNNLLSDDDAAAAAECLDFVDARRRLFEEARTKFGEHLAETVGVQDVPPIIELKETYLPIDDESFIDVIAGKARRVTATTAGYIDHGFISHDRTYAELFDWKFGFWPVEDANNNLQGLAYCLGILRAYPTVRAVKFFFKQPHLQSISETTVTREMIPALYLRIKVVVARARAARQAGDYATATPFVPVCNFCANIASCPKVTAFACKVAHKFHPLGIPENITPTMIHSSRDTVLGLQLAQVLAVWAKAFKTQVTDRVIRGEADLPADHVLQQRSDREVVSEEAYRTIALKYVTQKEYENACSVTFGKVESAIKEKAPRGQKTAAIETFNAELTASGAVKQGAGYTFLRAVARKKTTENETQ